MIVACSKCGEKFLLKPDHRGFANVCDGCFLPHKVTGPELEAARAALSERNRIISEEEEKKRRAELAEDRRRIETAWPPESALNHRIAYHAWIGGKSCPDDDELFVYSFRDMKDSKRRKFYV
jgi:hypothetical protein